MTVPDDKIIESPLIFVSQVVSQLHLADGTQAMIEMEWICTRCDRCKLLHIITLSHPRTLCIFILTVDLLEDRSCHL